MFVGAKEILRAAMDVREIATAATGDENFLADAVGALEDGDAATSFAGLDRTEEARGTCAENQSVKFVRQRNQAFFEPRGCKLSLRRSSG
jgi:hypothetical protein